MTDLHYRRLASGILGAALLLAACTTHKQETPSLTGPSELGTSLAIAASPDVLAQDGASQSLITITAHDSNGQLLRNVSLRAEIAVDGAITDFGRLSARNIVTDTTGRAFVTYTAPAPVLGISSDVIVQIFVTPAGSDFGNATARFAKIRLVPPGIIGPPTSPIKPDFAPPAATVGNPAVFTATFTGAGTVASVLWDFGDGSTAFGQNAQHTFDETGTFLVTVAILDTLGRTASASHSVIVGLGVAPRAVILIAPANPAIGQTASFNASGSTVEAGHRITDFSWDFGDGSRGSGVSTTHAYAAAGTYIVSLTVEDDAGRDNVATQTVTVGASAPTAAFTFSPSSPIANQTVSFNASTSTAGAGRTIVSYDWDFGDGARSSGVQTSHAYSANGSFTVLLTVTNDLGQTASAQLTVTVGPGTQNAAFTFSPSSPLTGTVVTFDASTSNASPGRTIASYSWNFDDGSPLGSGVQTTHTFTTNGTFVVRLTITDNTGLTATTTRNVVVGNDTPTAAFTFLPASPLANSTVNFDGTGSTVVAGRTITNYSWNFGDLSPAGSGATPSHIYTVAGNYTVTLTITDSAGRTALTTRPITVANDTPTAAFFFNPSSPLANSPVAFDGTSSTAAPGRTLTYSWDFGDSTGLQSGSTISHTYTTAGNKTVTLTVTDNVGRTNFVTKIITVASDIPTAAFNFSPANPVAGSPVTFDGASSSPPPGRFITSYLWDFGDPGSGSNSGVGSIQSHTYTTPGSKTVTLTVTDSAGRTNTTTRTFTVLP